MPMLRLFAVLLVGNQRFVVPVSHWVGIASHGKSFGGVGENNKPILGKLLLQTKSALLSHNMTRSGRVKFMFLVTSRRTCAT